MCLVKVVIFALLVVTLCEAQEESKDRYLVLPQLEKCNSRFKEAQYKNRNFFYSGHDPELKNDRHDWLDSRNKCRERCMEPVSFEDQEKFDFYKSFIEQNNISFIWTSGRLCDFAGCEGRWDLLPKRIKGWLWSANQVPIHPTNKSPPGWKYQPWSSTGERKKPQPDNAEFYLSQTGESCLAVLNNMYNDSISWHDVACYHNSRFICEDSELLLKEVLEKKEEQNTVENIESTSTKAEIASTTESKVLKREKKEEAVESSTQTKKRKVVRKKLKTAEPIEEKKTTESVEKNETTSETILTSTEEAQKLDGDETPNASNATDDAKDKVEDVAKDDPRVVVDEEEVESTTVIESTTKPTVRSRGRVRGRRPSPKSSSE